MGHLPFLVTRQNAASGDFALFAPYALPARKLGFNNSPPSADTTDGCRWFASCKDEVLLAETLS